MKMKTYSSFDDYLADQTRANQELIRELRRLVKRAVPALAETVKWGNGCWVKGKQPVAYAYSAPDHVQFGFFIGSALKDPKQLLRGKGRYVRHVRLTSKSDIDPRALTNLLRQAAKTPYGNYE